VAAARVPDESSAETVAIVPHGGSPPEWALRVGARTVQPSALDDERVALRTLARVGCALVDANDPHFVAVARRLNAIDPAVQVVLVAPPASMQAVRRSLLYAPGLGEIWVASPTEVTGALQQRAAGVTRQRHRFERTRRRMQNELLTASPQRSERALISDAYLAGLLQVLPDAVFSVDEAGRVLSANAAADRLFGTADGAVVGRRLRDVLQLATDVTDPALLRRAAGDEHLELAFRTASGEARIGELRAASMRVNDLGTTVWSVVLHDVTDEHALVEHLRDTTTELEAANEELQSTTEELMQRTEEAEQTAAALRESEENLRAMAAVERDARARADEANRAKSQFLANMSHELRTPLNAIAGYVQLLDLEVHGPVTDAQRNALTRVRRAQEHLLGLINDILNFAKLESGRVEYVLRAFPADAIVADVAPLMAPQFEGRNIAFESRVLDGARALDVCADRDKVRQVLLNLLSNAAKFTPPGGHVWLEVAPDGDASVAVRVRDTGHGIPPDRLESIFEPFVQVRAEYSSPHDGTGLGLAISRDLARGMKGDLTVESQEGRGSTFTLLLPRTMEEHRVS
jgi:PAS domain S-box-containing protein